MPKLVILAAALVLLGPGLAAAELFEIEGRYWSPDLTGAAKLKSGSTPGTRLDFADDLGLEAEALPELRFSFGLGNSRFRAAYGYTFFEGDERLEETIIFEGKTFPATVRVESVVEFHYGRFGWIWTPAIIPGVLRLGPMLELKGFLADIRLDTRGLTPEVREEAMLPIVLPTIGAATDVSIGSFQLFAEVSGLPAGDYGYLVDGEVGIRYEVPILPLALSAGYRIFEVRVGEDDDFGHLRLSGPFASLALRF
jgi:hypothetical protein